MYAPVSNGSKTFSISETKTFIYAKDVLAFYLALTEFGHLFGETPRLVIIMTDSKSVTRFP